MPLVASSSPSALVADAAALALESDPSALALESGAVASALCATANKPLGYCTRADSGDESGRPLNWSDEEVGEVYTILGHLGIDTTQHFDLNLTELMHDREAYSSQDPKIDRLRELIRKGLGDEVMVWDDHIAGESAGRANGGDLHLTRGVILSTMKWNYEHAIKVLNKPNLTTGKDHTVSDKSYILNGFCAAEKRHHLTTELLKRRKRMIEEEIKANPLSVHSGRERIKHLDNLLKQMGQEYDEQTQQGKNREGIVCLQALNSVDLESISDPIKKEKALERQRNQNREMIADESTWWREKGERFAYIAPRHEADKDETVDKMKGMNVNNRRDAHFLVRRNGECSEKFDVRYDQMVAKGTDPDKVDKFIDASLRVEGDPEIDWTNPQEANLKAFEGLHNKDDRIWMRDQLKNMAHGLGHVRRNAKIGSTPGDISDGPDSERLVKEFGDRYQSEYATYLDLFEDEVKNDKPITRIAAPVNALVPAAARNGGVAQPAPGPGGPAAGGQGGQGQGRGQPQPGDVPAVPRGARFLHRS